MAGGVIHLDGNSRQLHRIPTAIEVGGLQGPGGQRLRQGQISPVEPDSTPSGLLQGLDPSHVVKMAVGQGNGGQLQPPLPELLRKRFAFRTGVDDQALAASLPVYQIAIVPKGPNGNVSTCIMTISSLPSAGLYPTAV